jgi:hypothetical protein
MKILTDAELLTKIEEFLKRTSMPQTRFGRDAVGEASLLDRLRGGRSLSLRMANKVVAFMNDHDAASTQSQHDSADRKTDDRSTPETSAGA